MSRKVTASRLLCCFLAAIAWGPIGCARVQPTVSAATSTDSSGISVGVVQSGASVYRTIDLTAAFWQFWDNSKDLPVGDQQQRFLKEVVPRYPDVYRAGVIGLNPDLPYAEAFATRYARWSEMLRPHMGTMKRLSERIATDLPNYEGTFRRAFSDLDYRGDVYFLNSLGGFDGATRTINGATALLFGVDMIAYVYGDAADPQPLFHHELFHIYHSQFADAEGANRLYRKLWEEGLATYVSKALNPSAVGVTLFGLPSTMPERAQAMLPQLAAELRRDLDSTSREAYARFFFGNNDQAAVPSRSGYYVGYLVAEQIARGRELRDLARMTGLDLRTAIDNALRLLENAQGAPSPPGPGPA